MLELREETRQIVAAFEPQCRDETAAALQRPWSGIPPRVRGDALIKAEVREEFKALGWA
jgi:hypothetical protein